MRIPCTTHASRLWGPYNLYHDAACRVATVFEKFNPLIENSLRVRRENPPPIEPLPGLSLRSLLEYGGLKPILPFLGGRSDAACRVVIWTSSLPSMGILRFLQRRVVILPFAIPVDPPMGANDGRCGIPRNDLPANADCRGGVFATRRFPRPPPRLAHTVHPARWRPRSLCCDVACRVAAQNRQAAPLIAMRRTTSLQTPLNAALRSQKTYRDFKMPHRIRKCYAVSQHAALRLGILHCGVYSTPPFTARFTQQSAR